MEFPSGPRRNLALLAMVGGIFIQLIVAWQLRDQIAAGMPDFSNFYTAGKIVDLGEGSKLYDFATQARIEGTYTIRANPASFLRFYHAPFEVLVYAPLALLPFRTAFWVWWGCNAVLWAATLLMLRPHLPALEHHFDLVILLSSCFFPLLNSECQGQDSVLTLFLWAICYCALQTGRFGTAGTALAFSAYKPQFALPVLLVLGICSSQRRRIVGGFALAILGLCTLTFFLVGLRPFQDFPHALMGARSSATDLHVLPEVMPNLRGLAFSALERHTSAEVVGICVACLSAAVLLIAGALWGPGYRPENPSGFNLRFGLLVTGSLLVSYYCYMHDLTPLLLPMFFVSDWLIGSGLASWSKKLLAVCILSLMALPAVSWSGSPTYAAVTVVFFALISWELMRSRRNEAVFRA